MDSGYSWTPRMCHLRELRLIKEIIEEAQIKRDSRLGGKEGHSAIKKS